jgi:PTH1 family peptidyl-tRNA hydrolase
MTKLDELIEVARTLRGPGGCPWDAEQTHQSLVKYLIEEVSSLMKFYDVPLSNLIVLHDELDIDAETIRIKQGGGHAGHNGLRDIISACGSNDFTRVRIGIGRPPGRMDTADFVLKDFNSTERKNLPVTLELAADAVEEIVRSGVLEAQNKINPKG